MFDNITHYNSIFGKPCCMAEWNGVWVIFYDHPDWPMGYNVAIDNEEKIQ